MKIKRIISMLLAVLMCVGSFSLLVFAEEESTAPQYTYNTTNTTPTMEYLKGTYKDAEGKDHTVETPEDKLALMDYRYGTDKYGLYIDEYSGEVAVKNWATGDILFTNPYNTGTAASTSDSEKEKLLSQLVVNFTTITTDAPTSYYSYIEAAKRGQIETKYIKDGIRVEYTIGNELTKQLLPMEIEAEAFETKILEPLKYNIANPGDRIVSEDVLEQAEFDLNGLISTYKKLEPGQAYDAEYTNKFDFAIYKFGAASNYTTIAKYARLVDEWTEYTFEDLAEDHMKVEYESESENQPLFKMALEYTLDENGLLVRLPANGIRFDEAYYRINTIEILPYMGAGSNPNPGYNFFPDGSGTLFDFEDIASLNSEQRVLGKMYGQDYAYHEIEGKYEEILRYPVFGIVETETLERDIIDPETGLVTDTETYEKDRGFVAIIEEGESLMSLESYHFGPKSPYHTVKMAASPRPNDTYNTADATSVGTNTEWTVVSSRKYTGNFQIRYIMLTDEDVAAEKALTDTYACSYVGMAKAYRDYLVKNGTLTKLTSEDVEENIPLYVETFGAIETREKILSIPVDVMTPLTTFEDIKTMYDGFAAKGVNNVNFIMTGYTDGGLTWSKIPYKLKWEKAVSKEMKFEDLLAYANQEGFGLFPDFDFVFAQNNTMFDGLSLNKHAAKTIDNRYTSKREYSATKHTYVSYFELVISPAYFSHFYEKFTPKYQEYLPNGISLSTFGSYLNSDFDEDEPYNRADAQDFTAQALAYIDANLPQADIMTSGGNAYSWKYVDHITDIALDSSRYTLSSASVPFLGMVLHGYVEFAGSSFNMEGNLDYAFLKALESGAALKFILSYRNTASLKEYATYSKYYSVRYDIWFDDVVSLYLELNDLLKGVQTSAIVDHKFVNGVRVPDDDELAADLKAAIEEAIKREEAERIEKSEQEIVNVQAARNAIYNVKNKIYAYVTATGDGALATQKNNLEIAYNNYLTVLNATGAKEENLRRQLTNYYRLVQTAKDYAANVFSTYETAVAALEYLRNLDGFDAENLAILETIMSDTDIRAAYDKAKAYDLEYDDFAETIYTTTIAVFPNLADARFTYTTNNELNNNLGDKTVIKNESTKYKTDDNMIVYEKYENGMELYLNFNDYRVIVEHKNADGTVTKHTIGAYNYIVLSRGV